LAAATAVIAGCGDTASSAPAPKAKTTSKTASKPTPEAEKKQPPTDTEQLDALLADR
jgi:hypothetical protein